MNIFIISGGTLSPGQVVNYPSRVFLTPPQIGSPNQHVIYASVQKSALIKTTVSKNRFELGLIRNSGAIVV